MELSYTLVKN
jgi:hypothetical protein